MAALTPALGNLVSLKSLRLQNAFSMCAVVTGNDIGDRERSIVQQWQLSRAAAGLPRLNVYVSRNAGMAVLAPASLTSLDLWDM